MECVRRTHLSGASDFSGPLGRSQGAAGPHHGDRRGRLLGDRQRKCPSDVKQKQSKIRGAVLRKGEVWYFPFTQESGVISAFYLSCQIPYLQSLRLRILLKREMNENVSGPFK